MKHILKYSLGCLVGAATTMAMLTMVSCEDEDASSNLSSAIYPQSVTLNIPAAQQELIYTDNSGANVLPLVKGENVTLSYAYAPENITFNEFDWTSSNKSVATVDDNGVVTAVSGDGVENYAFIQISPSIFFSGSNIYSSLKVLVVNTLVAAQSIEVNAVADEVFAGETVQLSASILPADATYQTVKWTSSNESLATVDKNGVVTGKINDNYTAVVTISATSLDGAQVVGKKDITIKQIVVPESVTIDQSKSFDNGYVFAIADKAIALDYTTVPSVSTTSLIEWTSSNESIATVQNGVVTFNQDGVFGDITITATCPEGNSASIKLHLAEGLIRELFHDQNNYGWYNATQSGNGTASSHVWSYGKVTVTTYTQNATNQRGDFRSWNAKNFVHAGNYPILAIRMDDLMDMDEVTSRNITLDAAGSCNGTTYSGGLDGNNNKWKHDYKCSDGSHVFIYDLTTQKWNTGGILPTNALATFNTFQFKYADIRTLTRQVNYNVYWVQTFKTIADLQAYIASEGLTYDIIK